MAYCDQASFEAGKDPSPTPARFVNFADDPSHRISSIQGDDVKKQDIKNLIDSDFRTEGSVVLVPQKTLLRVKGMTEQKCSKLLKLPMGFSTASVVHEQRKFLIIIIINGRVPLVNRKLLGKHEQLGQALLYYKRVNRSMDNILSHIKCCLLRFLFVRFAKKCIQTKQMYLEVFAAE